MKLVHQQQSGPDVLYVFEESGARILKINQLSETHSVYHPLNPLVEPLEEHYWNFITILPYLAPMKHACILGLGAGTITRQLAHYHPLLKVTGIERDPAIISIATEFFCLEQPGLTIINDDGVRFIAHAKETYDLIILDAFENGNLSEAFLTNECFTHLSEHLSTTGIFAANYLFQAPLHQTIKQQCQETFAFVWTLQVANSSNYIILASNHDIAIENLSIHPIHPHLQLLAQYMRQTTRCLKQP